MPERRFFYDDDNYWTNAFRAYDEDSSELPSSSSRPPLSSRSPFLPIWAPPPPPPQPPHSLPPSLFSQTITMPRAGMGLLPPPAFFSPRPPVHASLLSELEVDHIEGVFPPMSFSPYRSILTDIEHPFDNLDFLRPQPSALGRSGYPNHNNNIMNSNSFGDSFDSQLRSRRSFVTVNSSSGTHVVQPQSTIDDHYLEYFEFLSSNFAAMLKKRGLQGAAGERAAEEGEEGKEEGKEEGEGEKEEGEGEKEEDEEKSDGEGLEDNGGEKDSARSIECTDSESVDDEESSEEESGEETSEEGESEDGESEGKERDSEEEKATSALSCEKEKNKEDVLWDLSPSQSSGYRNPRFRRWHAPPTDGMRLACPTGRLCSALDPRNYFQHNPSNQIFSRKYAFSMFGPLTVDWPAKVTEQVFPVRKLPSAAQPHRTPFWIQGYVFLIFHHEESVRKLVEACFEEDDKLFYNLPPIPSLQTAKPIQAQVRPWRLADADYIVDPDLPVNLRRVIFVGGVPRPIRAVELAHIMDRLYGPVACAGIDTDVDYKYPKGAGRVAFMNESSYVRAIQDKHAQLTHGDMFHRVRVEMKPYVLDDQPCDECDDPNGPFFCPDLECMQYYCESCWTRLHSLERASRHKPLIKEA